MVFTLFSNMLRDGKHREQLLQLVTEGKNAGMQIKTLAPARFCRVESFEDAQFETTPSSKRSLASSESAQI